MQEQGEDASRLVAPKAFNPLENRPWKQTWLVVGTCCAMLLAATTGALFV